LLVNNDIKLSLSNFYSIFYPPLSKATGVIKGGAKPFN